MKITGTSQELDELKEFLEESMTLAHEGVDLGVAALSEALVNLNSRGHFGGNVLNTWIAAIEKAEEEAQTKREMREEKELESSGDAFPDGVTA